ncbi:hypothetical protein BH24ACI5_BH24ACI5_09650 [soil metagenome]
MRGDRGLTLVELVIATAIMVALIAAVMTVLHDGLVRTPLLEEATDLHQRARVVADVLEADLRAAGSGTASGPLTVLFPGIEPRAPGGAAGSARADAVTIRYIPAHAARSRLAEPLDPAAASAVIGMAGCPHQTTACGFTAGSSVLVFDTSGQRDAFRVDAIATGTLAISAPVPRGVTYPAGAELAEATEVSYTLHAPTRELRRTEGGGTFAVVDHVESLAFEYVGDSGADLPLSIFQDGPFRAVGDQMFDTDLLGIRAVRVTIRLASGSNRVPGGTTRITVALRNGM